MSDTTCVQRTWDISKQYTSYMYNHVWTCKEIPRQYNLKLFIHVLKKTMNQLPCFKLKHSILKTAVCHLCLMADIRMTY
jgi:hypothetical protein